MERHENEEYLLIAINNDSDDVFNDGDDDDFGDGNEDLMMEEEDMMQSRCAGTPAPGCQYHR